MDEFEIATRAAEHEWALFDLTDTFPDWLATQRCAQELLPEAQSVVENAPARKYLTYIETEFAAFLQHKGAGEDFVVALKGVGSLFGFLKVKEVVDKLAPMVKELATAGVFPWQLRRQQLPLAGRLRRLELPGRTDHCRQRILIKGHPLDPYETLSETEGYYFL